MPVSLHPTNRRAFLAGLGSTLLIPALARAEEASVDADLIAILNDTHIGANHPPAYPIPTHLRETVDYLLRLPKKPAVILINGDLALSDGQPGDYEHFFKLIQPLRDAGMTLHLTLGNHDDRAVFMESFRRLEPGASLTESRYAAVVPARCANFFLLDSLKHTKIAAGDLGDGQIEWLKRQLDAHADKPAIVVAHHNPRLGGDPIHFPGGLEDSEALWKMLAERRHVKAYVHGHIHFWSLASHQDIHIVNTPATSYVANPEKSTTGWTMARLRDDGIDLTLHTHIQDHSWNGNTANLAWRS